VLFIFLFPLYFFYGLEARKRLKEKKQLQITNKLKHILLIHTLHNNNTGRKRRLERGVNFESGDPTTRYCTNSTSTVQSSIIYTYTLLSWSCWNECGGTIWSSATLFLSQHWKAWSTNLTYGKGKDCLSFVLFMAYFTTFRRLVKAFLGKWVQIRPDWQQNNRSGQTGQEMGMFLTPLIPYTYENAPFWIITLSPGGYKTSRKADLFRSVPPQTFGRPSISVLLYIYVKAYYYLGTISNQICSTWKWSASSLCSKCTHIFPPNSLLGSTWTSPESILASKVDRPVGVIRV